MSKKLSILLCTLLFTGMVYGETLRSFDAEKAELIGLKLGMTKDQAKSVLDKRYKKIGDGFFASEEEPSAQENNNDPYYAEKNTAHINYQIRINDQSSEGIALVFHKKTPSRASPFVLTAVLYQIPPTSENIEQLAIQAKKKYGAPSYSYAGNSLWCLAPVEEPEYGDNEASPYCPNQPSLSLEYDRISLSDPRPENQQQKRDNEKIQKLRTMKIDL